MAAGSCFRSKEEQLYMLEVIIDRMHLSPEKVLEAQTTPLCVRISFVDVPAFEIRQVESIPIKKREIAGNSNNPTSNVVVDFSTGKSCLFTKRPQDLVQAMQSRPLKVEVHKTASQPICGTVSDYVPICEAQIPLSGSMCDQVAMAMNDADHLPEPSTVKHMNNLMDGQGNLTGTIEISLRLSCFGNSIVTHFASQDESFLSKSSGVAEEFQCTKVFPNEKEAAKNAKDKVCIVKGHEKVRSALPQPQAVSDLPPICQKLRRRRDGKSGIVRPSLTAPTPAPRIGMNDPNFEMLTSAEKLNDRQYRGLVYRTYPNEPACACDEDGQYPDPSSKVVQCNGAGCHGRCCTASRRPGPSSGINNVSKGYAGSCDATTSQNAGISAQGSRDVPRMRGGGCCEGTRGNPKQKARPAVSNSSPATGNGLHGLAAHSNEFLSSCESPSRGPNVKTGCCCLRQVPSVDDMNANFPSTQRGAAWTKKPCLGADCLIRAFRETQDFVDSLGRVPGLAGLGLMDPSESPYFGRDRDYHADSVGASRKLLSPSLFSDPNQRSIGFSNAQTPRQPLVGANSAPVPFVPVTPFAIAAAHRSGVVREAVPILPELGTIALARTKRRDDKADKQKELDLNPSPLLETGTGPCEEPKCKSRRRGLQSDVPVVETAGFKESTMTKSTSQLRTTSAGLSRAGGGSIRSDRGKLQMNARSGMPGPSGDRNISTRSPVRASRRAMRFVYGAGAMYPGVNYGHKNCVDARLRVPANMGWLWSANTGIAKLKPRVGWRPGAIAHSLIELLKKAKMGSRAGRSSSAPSRGKKRKLSRSKSFTSLKKPHGSKRKENEEEVEELPPTLHIHRKDGTYYVTMYPIKQETMEVPQLEEPMKPLQFKITKTKEDGSGTSSSTASDMEIEFSPPAAVNRYRKKPNVIHVETQVKQQEIIDAFKPPGDKKHEKKGKQKKKK